MRVLALCAVGCVLGLPASGCLLEPIPSCDPSEPGCRDAGFDAGDAAEVPDSGPIDSGACAECDADHCVGGECVQCTAATASADCTGQTLLCVDNRCVGCAGAADCTEPNVPICEEGACAPCTADPQCADIAEGPLCDESSGRCVECDQLDASRCGGNPCRPNGRCSDYPSTQEACQPCDTDANCREGQLCVEMTYAVPPPERVVGTFCQWRQDATAADAPNGQCANTRLESRPWARRVVLAESVDGELADICTLATTTCPAFLQHRQAVAGCDAPLTGDAACGAPDLNDGLCRYQTPPTNPRCTYPCLGTEDCAPGSTCPAAGDRFCSI